MQPWTHEIDISSAWHNDELSFEERRDLVVAEFRSHGFLEDGEHGMELSLLIDELAEAPDEEDFNYWWDQVYDLADRGKFLWIHTFTAPRS